MHVYFHTASKDQKFGVNVSSALEQGVSFRQSFQDFLSAVKLLLKNPTFSCVIIAMGIESFLLSGFAVFLAKLFQNQFSIAPSTASLLAGK